MVISLLNYTKHLEKINIHGRWRSEIADSVPCGGRTRPDLSPIKINHVFLNRVQQTVSGSAPPQHPPDTIKWTLFRCSLRVKPCLANRVCPCRILQTPSAGHCLDTHGSQTFRTLCVNPLALPTLLLWTLLTSQYRTLPPQNFRCAILIPCLWVKVLILAAPQLPQNPGEFQSHSKVTKKWLSGVSLKVTQKWLFAQETSLLSHFEGNPGKSLFSHFCETLKFSRVLGELGGSRDHEVKACLFLAFLQGALKVTDLRWQRKPKAPFSWKFKHWEGAGNRRFSQKTEDFCRKPQETADWGPSP